MTRRVKKNLGVQIEKVFKVFFLAAGGDGKNAHMAEEEDE